MLTESQRDKLRSAREHRGLSLRQAADKAGICHSAWSHIETGRNSGSVDTIKAMAKVVGLELRILLVRVR